MSPEHYCVHEISGVSWNSFGFFEAMLKRNAIHTIITSHRMDFNCLHLIVLQKDPL